jgi:hypothetical protein
MIRVTVAALPLFALAGCAGINAETPRSVSTFYDPIFHSPQDATDLAEAHCQAQGGLHAIEAGWTTYKGLPSIDWWCVEGGLRRAQGESFRYVR